MSRLFLALRCFLAVLFYYRLPREAVALLPPPDLRPPSIPPGPPEPVEAGPTPESPPAPPPVQPVVPAPPPAELSAAERDALRHRGAVQILAVLQREGRLVDFLMEEVEGYGDAQIGAAARDIHRGCRKGLLEHLRVAPVRPEPDEAAVRIEEGYDPSAVRLIGNIQGRPPFHGTLRHHGWRAGEVQLPDLPSNHDPRIIAPAEVELGG